MQPLLLLPPTTYCPSCTLLFDTLLLLFLSMFLVMAFLFLHLRVAWVGVGFDGYRTLSALHSHETYLRLWHGDVAVHPAHFMGSFSVSCLLAFTARFAFTIYHCSVSVEISLMGLDKGLREFFLFIGDWPHIRDMDTKMDWNGSIVCVVPHGIEGRLCT